MSVAKAMDKITKRGKRKFELLAPVTIRLDFNQLDALDVELKAERMAVMLEDRGIYHLFKKAYRESKGKGICYIYVPENFVYEGLRGLNY